MTRMTRMTRFLLLGLLFLNLITSTVIAVDSKVTINQKATIVGVDSSTIAVYLGSKVDLPDKVKVRYSDGKTNTMPVRWDNGAANTSKAGIVSCKGTVDGYVGKAIIVLNVIPYIKEEDTYSDGQLIAMNNCLAYRKRFFSQGRPINKQAVRIITASTLMVGDYFVIDGFKNKKSVMDSTDWIIAIGNTGDHDFYIFVCDSHNYEVLGYLPIA